MGIQFTENPAPTIGVELELGLVERGSGELVHVASHLLEELGRGHPDGEHPNAKHELFECTVELITDVCRTVGEAKADIGRTLVELQTVADRHGVAAMAAGTHPYGLARDQQVSPSDRYHQLVEDMQWPARRLLIFGTHVHVGVPSGEQAIVVANELLRHLPLLIALSASSPFFEGEDTGMASARSMVFESLPTAGLPPQLDDWTDFEAFMATLLHARCISSVREVWWDVRPHPDFGTVELRMCDAQQTLTEVASVAALAHCIVADTLDQHARGVLAPRPRQWTVQENRWLAARYGTDAELIVDEHGSREPVKAVLEELITTLEPVADRLGCSEELVASRAILDHGPGYERQRRALARRNRPTDVVDMLIDELERDRPTPHTL